MPDSQAIAAYVPVLHRGYLQFFDEFADVKNIYIFDNDVLKQIHYLRKEVRALTPEQQVDVLTKLKRFESVKLLGLADIENLDSVGTKLIMPDEDVSRTVAEKLSQATVTFYPIFLRWDRRAVNAEDPVNPDRTVSNVEFDHEVMRQANDESRKSSNIWRRVGAAIVKNGKILVQSSNRHMPTEHSLWIDGDPRGTLNKGIGIDVTTDMHAEAKLIANAARNGESLKGASMYVTNFPCPNCAKLIAEAGFTKCYYSAGYALLDGEKVLKAFDVELIHVSEPEDQGQPAEWVPYKKS